MERRHQAVKSLRLATGADARKLPWEIWTQQKENFALCWYPIPRIPLRILDWVKFIGGVEGWMTQSKNCRPLSLHENRPWCEHGWREFIWHKTGTIWR